MATNGKFSPSNGSDAIANEEALKLATGGDLDKAAEVREHGRHQTFRDHVNRATLILFWLIIICVAIGVLSFVLHLVTPACWHYLKEKQLDDLKSMLGAAVLSSALTGYANQRMRS
jgi:hypothetical protein